MRNPCRNNMGRKEGRCEAGGSPVPGREGVVLREAGGEAAPDAIRVQLQREPHVVRDVPVTKVEIKNKTNLKKRNKYFWKKWRKLSDRSFLKCLFWKHIFLPRFRFHGCFVAKVTPCHLDDLGPNVGHDAAHLHAVPSAPPPHHIPVEGVRCRTSCLRLCGKVVRWYKKNLHRFCGSWFSKNRSLN